MLMATKDYLHSDLLRRPQNNEVFQRTYATIEHLTGEFSNLLEITYEGDPKSLNEFKTMYLNLIEEQVVEVVNLAINKFDKR